jgi:hypothetical protein
MSPTQAKKVAAVCRLTPGTLISRRISSEPTAASASARSSSAISASRKSIWRRQPSTVWRSSTGARGPPGAAFPSCPRGRRPPGGRAGSAAARPRSRSSPGCAGAPAGPGEPPTAAAPSFPRRGTTPRPNSPREQLGEPPGVEPVGLCLGLGDLPQLLRVHDHDPRHVRAEDPGDRLGAAGRLQRHLVVSTEALGEQLELGPAGPHPAGRAHAGLLQDRHLAELAVDVQPDVSHGDLLLPIDDAGDQVGKRHRRIRAPSTSGSVAGAATEKHGLAAHPATAHHPAFSQRPPRPGTPDATTTRTARPAAPKTKFHGRRSRSRDSSPRTPW